MTENPNALTGPALRRFKSDFLVHIDDEERAAASRIIARGCAGDIEVVSKTPVGRHPKSGVTAILSDDQLRLRRWDPQLKRHIELRLAARRPNDSVGAVLTFLLRDWQRALQGPSSGRDQPFRVVAATRESVIVTAIFERFAEGWRFATIHPGTTSEPPSVHVLTKAEGLLVFVPNGVAGRTRSLSPSAGALLTDGAMRHVVGIGRSMCSLAIRLGAAPTITVRRERIDPAERLRHAAATAKLGPLIIDALG
ncbi:hypothetical protein [Sphingomonas sp. UYP23]